MWICIGPHADRVHFLRSDCNQRSTINTAGWIPIIILSATTIRIAHAIKPGR